MIAVTKLDNSTIMVNVEMIQSLQSAPDTVITFTNQEHLIVKEPVEEISKRIIEYRKSVHSNLLFEPGVYEKVPSSVN